MFELAQVLRECAMATSHLGWRKNHGIFFGAQATPNAGVFPHEIRLLTTMTCLIIPQERPCFLGEWHWAVLGHLDSHEQNPKTVTTHDSWWRHLYEALLGGSFGLSIHLYWSIQVKGLVPSAPNTMWGSVLIGTPKTHSKTTCRREQWA